MGITEQLKIELKRLHNQGVNLINAMQVEQFHDDMDAHFTNTLKKDFLVFKQGLPNFAHSYQAWYTESQHVIGRYLPGRLTDFKSLYETPKGRKEIRQDNYVIEDYLRSTVITAGFDKKVVATPADAIPLVQQQLNILDSIESRLESHLTDIASLLLAQLTDKMLLNADELIKNGFARSAGALCGVILEQHLDEIRINHQLKVTKKTMTIKDYNELFKKAATYDFNVYRQVQYLSDLRDLCVKNKKTAPTAEQIEDMVAGTKRLIKTIF